MTHITSQDLRWLKEKQSIPIYKKVARKSSQLEIEALWRIKQANLPEPKPEYIFCPGRRFRFDYAYPDEKIAIELEGGVWIQGRHNRGQGFINDCEKYNLACVMGWKVLRYTAGQIGNLTADLKLLLNIH